MKDESSIFDAEPENLDKLVFEILGEPEPKDESSTASIADGALEQPGGQIGRYKLLSILGEGGMGVVYLAEQYKPIRRQVALKVVKPGMDSARVIARFEAERQALALLDYPNIAHVYEAGTTEAGRPYFVMEYIKGLSITEHCDRHKLTIEDRLELFRQVCLAVHHAHQKGIIHRDIKPSNILISTQDDQAIPKIIDFGVAKALAQPLTERTLVTEQGQLFGTPEYMSPEQADMANEDIDTRSDIYSLGVLLYVLLTGVLPFDSDTLREGGIDHIRKVIRETDPKTPSIRLTRLGEEAGAIAQNRRTEIQILARHLRKELEWIPLKAMRKERIERYRSASELADDIENYLKGNPLIAGPLAVSYRFKKFVRRNKKVFAGVVVSATALVIGLTVSTISLVRVQHARRIAVASQEKEAGLREQAQANELEMRRIAYASDMSLAQQALAINDMGRAWRLLEAYRPAAGEIDLRGWEWRYLWQECRSDALGEFCRYQHLVGSVAYSPNGRVLAVAGGLHQEFIDIWDVPSRKRIANLQPKEGSRVVFSHRGDLLATNARNHIRLRRTGAWDLVRQVSLAGDVLVLKFSPDGTRLASLSLPDELTVWEANQWAVVCQIRGVRLTAPRFGDLDFSPDGKALVIGDRDGHLRVIDPTSGNAILDPWQAHPEPLTAVAWSPNGSVIVSGSGWEGGPIRLWDAASGKALGELEGHTSWISELVFSKNGVRLYSASGDQAIRIWDIGQRSPLAILRGSSHDILGLALSPDGTTLASTCKDGIIAFWNADPQPEEEWPRVIPLGDSARPAFALDSRLLAVLRAGTVSLFDLETSKEIEQLPVLGTDVSVVTYSPDGTLLVSGCKSGKIRVWSCVERRPLRELDGHKEQIRLLRFRADGRRLLSVDTKGQAFWWGTLTWQSVRTFTVGVQPFWAGAVSPDGRLLVFGTETGAVRWFNAETGELLDTTPGGDRPPWQVAFSRDGLRLASTSSYGTVALWDPSSFKLLTKLDGHILGALGVAFSPDDRRVATGGGTSRDAVKLWDLSTQRDLITLPGQSGASSFVVFSPDGSWLAAHSRDEGKLHLWRAPLWEEIEAEEKRLESGQSP